MLNEKRLSPATGVTIGGLALCGGLVIMWYLYNFPSSKRPEVPAMISAGLTKWNNYNIWPIDLSENTYSTVAFEGWSKFRTLCPCKVWFANYHSQAQNGVPVLNMTVALYRLNRLAPVSNITKVLSTGADSSGFVYKDLYVACDAYGANWIEPQTEKEFCREIKRYVLQSRQ
jgi:hypothetical protein